MKILILSNKPYDYTPYNDWLNNDQIELFYVVDKNVSDSYSQISNVTAVSGYINTVKVELEAYKIVEENNIDKIIVRGEKDVLRASKIRSIFNLQGIKFSEALYFRDKELMKKKAKEQSIEIANYKVCHDSLDILQFSKINKFPIIIKPIRESGSTGVQLLKNQKRLLSKIKTVRYY